MTVLILICLLIVAYSKCDPDPPPQYVELRLALEAYDMDNLAFAIDSKALCTEISLKLRTPRNEEQQVWEAQTRNDKGEFCPNPWRWGEGLDKEGWAVSGVPPPLSPNRLYYLRIKNAGGSQGFLAFCAFQNGRLVSDHYEELSKELMGCIHENLPEETFTEEPPQETEETPEEVETPAHASAPLGPSPLFAIPIEPRAWEAPIAEENEALECEEDCEEAEEKTED
ncbi:MAG: hypothetical protein FWD46_07325 [Cystobacterineae bacterium]|nr:hypothetical protein [Cystobacterineae bacterium]